MNGPGAEAARRQGKARQEARDGHTDHTGDYLVGIPLLGTYLEEGLNQFGLSCE